MTQGSTVVSDHGAQLLGAGAVEENLEFVNLVAGIHQGDGIDRVGPGALATQAHGVQRKGNRGGQGGPEFDIIIDHLGRGVDEFNVAGLGGPSVHRNLLPQDRNGGGIRQAVHVPNTSQTIGIGLGGGQGISWVIFFFAGYSPKTETKQEGQ